MAMIPFNPARPGYTTMSPLLVTEDFERELDFIRAVFKPEITDTEKTQLDGRREVKIGNTTIFIIAAVPGISARQGAILVYVKNIRDTFQRARDAGATIHREPSERFNGDLECAFSDPEGNYWLCTQFEKLVNQENMTARYNASLQAK